MHDAELISLALTWASPSRRSWSPRGYASHPSSSFDAAGRIEALAIEGGAWEPRTDDVPMMLVRPGRSVKVLTDRRPIRGRAGVRRE